MKRTLLATFSGLAILVASAPVTLAEVPATRSQVRDTRFNHQEIQLQDDAREVHFSDSNRYEIARFRRRRFGHRSRRFRRHRRFRRR